MHRKWSVVEDPAGRLPSCGRDDYIGGDGSIDFVAWAMEYEKAVYIITDGKLTVSVLLPSNVEVEESHADSF